MIIISVLNINYIIWIFSYNYELSTVTYHIPLNQVQARVEWRDSSMVLGKELCLFELSLHYS